MIRGGQGRSPQSVRDDASGCLALVVLAVAGGGVALLLSWLGVIQ